MKRFSPSFSIHCFCLLILSVFTQTNADDIRFSLLQGVVIEKITKNSEAEKAGLQAGDILSSWTRGDAKGQIETPFDLAETEIEQSPRGNVTLEGLRGTEQHSWTLGPDVWGIEARPNFQGKLLDIHQQGQQLFAAGKFNEAAARWRAGAEEAQRTGIGSAGPWLLLRAAETLSDARQYKDADAAYQQAAQMVEGANSKLIAQLLRARADRFQRRNDLDNAEKYYPQALAESEKSGSKNLTIALILDSLGLVAEKRGNLVKAQEYYSQALEIQQSLASGSLCVATSLTGLGNVAEDRQDLSRVEEYYSQALEIRRRLAPGSLAVARSLNNLGNAAKYRGDLEKAEGYYDQSLDIKRRFDSGSLDVAKSLNNLGEVARQRGDLERAEQYQHQALIIKKKLAPGSLDVATSTIGLGNVFGDRGDLAKAEEYYGQALMILQKLAPESMYVAFVCIDLGEVSRRRGDLAKAEGYYRRALAIAENLSSGGPEAALTIQDLGELALARHDAAKAEQYFRQALAIRESIAPGSSDHAESLAALASILRDKQQLDAATHLFEQALNALEDQTTHLGGSQDLRSEFRARYSDYYRDYMDLLMSQKRPEEAFHVAERWRARSLLETLAAARVDIRRGADPELVKRERSLLASMNAKRDRRVLLLTGEHTTEQVGAVDKEIQGLRAEYDQVENRVRATSPAYAALTQPQPLTVSEIQQLLDRETLLLEYSLGKKRSYLWALTATTFTARELPGRAVIEATARRLYRQMSTRSNTTDGAGRARYKQPDRLDMTAAVMSRMILRPVAEELRGKQLVIVADGALQYTPFAFLPQPGEPGGVPLIQGHEITYLPSASMVAELRREADGRQPAPKAVAVLADPVFDRSDSRVASMHHERSRPLPTRGTTPSQLFTPSLMRSVADVGLMHLSRLPYSRREADAIMAVTPAGQGFKAVGFDASRSTATNPELAQYRVVHFATHALSDNHHPELSGLVLSLVDKEGRPQNGFLDLQDIYNLNLPADLVVLSGCETALGKEIQGEGIIGLTRGFMYAGATRVVASLWNVDDASTKILMERFYRAMEHEGMRPAAALRSAQIALWKQLTWRDPFYWAAFQIQGEWK
jgi:CHAT domain-containing protein/tetratricopeptide (TPR) repeat protein